jgi:NADPH:quinone reductase-like Zn-dependent oxidoreductase
MKAIGQWSFGGPDVLEIVDLPTPAPGRGEVRIRVHAAAVNPTDIGFRSGGMRDRMAELEPPYVPGMDAAGVVEEIGPDTETDLKVGDSVMALVLPISRHRGAYAEQIVLPAASVVAVPAGLGFPEAASVLMNATTARMALDALAVPTGEPLLVTGAAGAFGGHAVEMAAADGIRVLADAAPADRGLVESLGAQTVLPRGDGLAEAVRSVVPGGVPGVADGALLHDTIVPAIADGGGLAVVRGWDGQPGRGITVHPIWVRFRAQDTELLRRVRDYVESGAMRARVADVLPAQQAAQAHERLAAGGVRGRLILDLTTLS